MERQIATGVSEPETSPRDGVWLTGRSPQDDVYLSPQQPPIDLANVAQTWDVWPAVAGNCVGGWIDVGVPDRHGIGAQAFERGRGSLHPRV